jgi:hypothetical protein
MHAKYADVVPTAKILSYFNELPADCSIYRPATAALHRRSRKRRMMLPGASTGGQAGEIRRAPGPVGVGITAPPNRENDMNEKSRRPLLEPNLRGVHHLALCTDDMKATIDFYVDVLGMSLVHAMKVPPGLGTGPGNRGNPPYERVPDAAPGGTMRSISARSSAVSTMSAARTFSSMCVRDFAPGMGTMKAPAREPWAIGQAIESWVSVAFFRRAMASSAERSRRFFSTLVL